MQRRGGPTGAGAPAWQRAHRSSTMDRQPLKVLCTHGPVCCSAREEGTLCTVEEAPLVQGPSLAERFSAGGCELLGCAQALSSGSLQAAVPALEPGEVAWLSTFKRALSCCFCVVDSSAAGSWPHQSTTALAMPCPWCMKCSDRCCGVVEKAQLDPAGEQVAQQPKSRLCAALGGFGQALVRHWGFPEAVNRFTQASALAAALTVEETLQSAAGG